MPRINRTRAEHSALVAKARRSSREARRAMAVAGRFDERLAELEAERAAALARGDELAARAASNSITVLNLHRPKEG